MIMSKSNTNKKFKWPMRCFLKMAKLKSKSVRLYRKKIWKWWKSQLLFVKRKQQLTKQLKVLVENHKENQIKYNNNKARIFETLWSQAIKVKINNRTVMCQMKKVTILRFLKLSRVIKKMQWDQLEIFLQIWIELLTI